MISAPFLDFIRYCWLIATLLTDGVIYYVVYQWGVRVRQGSTFGRFPIFGFLAVEASTSLLLTVVSVIQQMLKPSKDLGARVFLTLVLNRVVLSHSDLCNLGFLREQVAIMANGSFPQLYLVCHFMCCQLGKPYLYAQLFLDWIIVTCSICSCPEDHQKVLVGSECSGTGWHHYIHVTLLL